MPDEPRYRDAVIIGWTILWKGVGSFLLLLFLTNLAVIALLPELTRTGPSLWALLVPLAVVTAVCTGAIMPLVVRSLFRQRFGGFHLELIRDQPDAPASFSDRRSPHDTPYRSSEPRRGAMARDVERDAARRSG